MCVRERERESQENKKQACAKLGCSMGTIPHRIGLWVHGGKNIRVLIQFRLDFDLFVGLLVWLFWVFLMLFMKSNHL